LTSAWNYGSPRTLAAFSWDPSIHVKDMHLDEGSISFARSMLDKTLVSTRFPNGFSYKIQI